MKKSEEFAISKAGVTKRPPHSENFCAGQGNQGQSTKVLRPKDNYTEITLSTYKKFRMVIPNFL